MLGVGAERGDGRVAGIGGCRFAQIHFLLIIQLNWGSFMLQGSMM